MTRSALRLRRLQHVVGGAPGQETVIDETEMAAVSPVVIERQQSAGSRAPVRTGPTKTAMGNYRPYRGRWDENRPAPPKTVAHAAHAEEIQHG